MSSSPHSFDPSLTHSRPKVFTPFIRGHCTHNTNVQSLPIAHRIPPMPTQFSTTPLTPHSTTELHNEQAIDEDEVVTSGASPMSFLLPWCCYCKRPGHDDLPTKNRIISRTQKSRGRFPNALKDVAIATHSAVSKMSIEEVAPSNDDPEIIDQLLMPIHVDGTKWSQAPTMKPIALILVDSLLPLLD